MKLDELSNIEPWEWPEETGAMLLSILKDKSSSEKDKLQAIEYSGDLVAINDDLVQQLLILITDTKETEEMRAKATLALAPVLEFANQEGFEEPEDIPISEKTYNQIRQKLHDVFQDQSTPTNVRRRALECSARAAQSWVAGAIEQAYNQNDEQWKLTAVFCMYYVPGFDQYIMESLESQDLYLHYHALEAAGNWEIQAAWPHIKHLLTASDTPKEILCAAIEVSVLINPEQAIEHIEQYLDHQDADIAGVAMDTLNMYDDSWEDYDDFDLDDDEDDSEYDDDDDYDDEDDYDDDDDDDDDYDDEDDQDDEL
ncbi:hypothetical protein JXQ70_15180 [bacterium]|nr:hypothetical protein [bacterium]